MQPAKRPWWQQATALVSLSAGGAVTGFHFAPKPAADLNSPSNIQVRLLALAQAARPARSDDSALRSAIVHVAQYYLRMAQHKTPAEMEALIWQHDSTDGADHGESCAAFASLTLELAAQVVGRESWVTAGSTYPWPLHDWAVVRVDANPASPGIISVQTAAQEQHRWHPLGDGYRPLPGDWVLFHQHVEVVTGFADGVLRTIGGDSLPNMSVNAHEYRGSLAEDGVVGFVNNGDLPAGTGSGSVAASATPAVSAGQDSGASSGTEHRADGQPASKSSGRASGAAGADAGANKSKRAAEGGAEVPGAGLAGPATAFLAATGPASPKPKVSPPPKASSHPATGRYSRHHAARSTSRSAGAGGSSAEQAFIRSVAPGAMATQRRYGVPASVTIAQAIDESGWGHSTLAARDHNLFGIKGAGPDGSDAEPTQEYVNGHAVTVTAKFRVYADVAQSIEDHGRLLATSGYYTRAMADRQDPNEFAVALTGVYATDPDYGAKLIGLMRRYDLYRYNIAALATPPATGSDAHAGTGPAPAPHTPAAHSPAAPDAGGPVHAKPSPAASIPGAPGPAASAPAPSSPAPSSPAASAPTATRTTAPRTTAPRAAAPGTADAAIPGVPGGGATVTSAGGAGLGGAAIPGTTAVPPAVHRARSAPAAHTAAVPGVRTAAVYRAAGPGASGSGPAASVLAASAIAFAGAPTAAADQARTRATGRTAGQAAGRATARGPRGYKARVPLSVQSAFNTLAKMTLLRNEPLYREVAGYRGLSWELLAACDWMQCEARARYSPVNGEKLGTPNLDGTVYRTRSEALDQCADDLVELSWAVYRIDVTGQQPLSVRELAETFAAFRWGGLLRLHRTSAMEFPYSVAGLTDQHLTMRWPNIADPNAPDKPGSRFRKPFGAVPIVLGLRYRAIA
jgi:flagellum-specific peptidoglycan hydrolase FlgJ